jgi:predicted O-linked N-acetylglucosamine transferase (SPINDLY family)
VVLGTLAREEKLKGPDYLSAVAAILKARPEALFFWTGKTRDPVIERAFNAAGVAAQTHFLGWVDTRLYAQVIDIFLDSFPPPCGVTLVQAMVAGKPFVSYACPESERLGIAGFIGPQLAGRGVSAEEQTDVRRIFGVGSATPLYFHATTPAEYVEMATRLIGDHELRARAGHAARTYVEKYLTNLPRMGETYARQIDAIVRETMVRRQRPKLFNFMDGAVRRLRTFAAERSIL